MASELYAKEFMEMKERFAAIGFELVGTKSDSGKVEFYLVKEISKS